MSEETKTNRAQRLAENLGIDQIEVAQFVHTSLIKGLIRILFEKGIVTKPELVVMVENRIEMENQLFQNHFKEDWDDETKTLIETQQNEIIEMLTSYIEGISKL